ncbi:TatD family nuclease-associated radical SAM protein [bacterium]|nr:TatD family nuclease-associated radical SAM protein [bacterium]
MSDTYVYSITQDNPETIYINLTNKCTNNCVFCIRNSTDPIKGKNLWLENEDVTLDKIKSQLKHFSNIKEAVFCGYGEPTVKLDLLKDVSKYLKSENAGIKIRINTNGQGNLINNKNIIPELKNIVDEISVSLNASNNKDYMEISGCKNEKAYESVKDFIKQSVENGFNTTATVVTGYKNYEVDVKACEQIAKQSGAEFRVREWIDKY